MFGLSTIVQMNKRAAAMFKDKPPKTAEYRSRNPVFLPGESFDEQEVRSKSENKRTTPESGFCVFDPVPHEAPKFDFTVQKKGPNMGCLVTPVTEAARNWTKARFCYSEDYRGASAIVKHRDLSSLLFDIERAGLIVETL